MTPTYPIVTERLLLRPFAAADLDALAAIQSRPEVARYLYWKPRPRAEVAGALERRLEQTRIEAEGDALVLAVVVRETDTLVGDVLLWWRSAEHRQGEVGYVFHPDHAGRGYATEASRAALRLGFEDLGLHRIVARCDARNGASARVMERLGMRREAHLRENEFVKGEWCDELVYALLEDEWATMARRA
ncbi:MAG TPA: GNAT family protein, partial [Thermomicrobiales bacterium]|nr:GNAT family protein [Thermomicrobiales bacterium]